MKRRTFLKTSGALVVSITASRLAGPADLFAQSSGPHVDPDFHQLDSWIVIHENNTATFYVGKTDLGQGTGTGFRQLMSDELDIAFDQTTCIMGRTDITVNQGGSGGSSAMERDSWPMRRAAAEARRVLLEMASSRLGAPVDQLAVSNAVITVKADPSKRVTYGQLIAAKKQPTKLTFAGSYSRALAPLLPFIDTLFSDTAPSRYNFPESTANEIRNELRDLKRICHPDSARLVDAVYDFIDAAAHANTPMGAQRFGAKRAAIVNELKRLEAKKDTFEQLVRDGQ